MQSNNVRTLSNGVQMPGIGMGTYPLQGRAMTKAVVAAVQCGYRAFDTAHAYANEGSLGNALQEAYRISGVKRAEVFITSKIEDRLDNGTPDGKLFQGFSPNEKRDIRGIVAEQLTETLKHLQTDYLDLLLIHWPHPDCFVDVWKAMEDEYRAGRVRSIGVSNFRERHLQKIIDAGSIVPMVNQFELHPLNTKKNLIKHCQRLNIQVEAYSPLLVMRPEIMNAPVLSSLAKKYNKSLPQIILRWDVQQGVIPIPKSGNPERLRENIDIFDFELTPEDMQGIDSLNQDFIALSESWYCPGY